MHFRNYLSSFVVFGGVLCNTAWRRWGWKWVKMGWVASDLALKDWGARAEAMHGGQGTPGADSAPAPRAWAPELTMAGSAAGGEGALHSRMWGLDFHFCPLLEANFNILLLNGCPWNLRQNLEFWSPGPSEFPRWTLALRYLNHMFYQILVHFSLN